MMCIDSKLAKPQTTVSHISEPQMSAKFNGTVLGLENGSLTMVIAGNVHFGRNCTIGSSEQDLSSTDAVEMRVEGFIVNCGEIVARQQLQLYCTSFMLSYANLCTMDRNMPCLQKWNSASVVNKCDAECHGWVIAPTINITATGSIYDFRQFTLTEDELNVRLNLVVEGDAYILKGVDLVTNHANIEIGRKMQISGTIEAASLTIKSSELCVDGEIHSCGSDKIKCSMFDHQGTWNTTQLDITATILKQSSDAIITCEGDVDFTIHDLIKSGWYGRVFAENLRIFAQLPVTLHARYHIRNSVQLIAPKNQLPCYTLARSCIFDVKGPVRIMAYPTSCSDGSSDVAIMGQLDCTSLEAVDFSLVFHCDARVKMRKLYKDRKPTQNERSLSCMSLTTHTNSEIDLICDRNCNSFKLHCKKKWLHNGKLQMTNPNESKSCTIDFEELENRGTLEGVTNLTLHIGKTFCNLGTVSATEIVCIEGGSIGDTVGGTVMNSFKILCPNGRIEVLDCGFLTNRGNAFINCSTFFCSGRLSNSGTINATALTEIKCPGSVVVKANERPNDTGKAKSGADNTPISPSTPKADEESNSESNTATPGPAVSITNAREPRHSDLNASEINALLNKHRMLLMDFVEPDTMAFYMHTLDPHERDTITNPMGIRLSKMNQLLNLVARDDDRAKDYFDVLFNKHPKIYDKIFN